MLLLLPLLLLLLLLLLLICMPQLLPVRSGRKHQACSSSL